MTRTLTRKALTFILNKGQDENGEPIFGRRTVSLVAGDINDDDLNNFITKFADVIVHSVEDVQEHIVYKLEG